MLVPGSSGICERWLAMLEGKQCGRTKCQAVCRPVRGLVVSQRGVAPGSSVPAGEASIGMRDVGVAPLTPFCIWTSRAAASACECACTVKP